MKNYHSKGDRLNLVATAVLVAGQLHVVGDRVVAALGPAAIGEEYVGLLEGEVEGTLKAAQDPGILAKMYLDANGELTTEADDGSGPPAVAHTFAGYCSEASTGKIVLAG